MKTIEEINKIAPYHPCEWQQGYGIWQGGYMAGQKDATAEQKAIDIEKACEWIMDELRNPKADTFQEFVDNFRKAMEE